MDTTRYIEDVRFVLSRRNTCTKQGKCQKQHYEDGKVIIPRHAQLKSKLYYYSR